jgi:membrane protein DedA with SNARE-associated domain
MAETVSEALGGAVEPWGYVLLFALTALEASAFVGLFVPGETALLLGGFLAYQGKLNLAAVIAITVVGGILGDSAGYELGRHLGDRIKRTWFGNRVGHERWERARAYVRDKGGRAVLLGRFVGILRALVPAVAGDSRMPYATFIVWNVIGALVWGPSVVVAGFLAGRSWRVFETYLSRGGFALLGLIVVIAAALHLVRKRRERREARDRYGT